MGLFVVGLSSTYAAKDEFNKEPPVWQIQLKDFLKPSRPFQNCDTCVQITFLTEDILAVTFQTGEPAPAKVDQPDSVSSGPNEYRTILIDVNSGQSRATHDWKIPLGGLKIIPTHDGKFLAQTLN